MIGPKHLKRHAPRPAVGCGQLGTGYPIRKRGSHKSEKQRFWCRLLRADGGGGLRIFSQGRTWLHGREVRDFRPFGCVNLTLNIATL